jgi:hypothetical protein
MECFQVVMYFESVLLDWSHKDFVLKPLRCSTKNGETASLFVQLCLLSLSLVLVGAGQDTYGQVHKRNEIEFVHWRTDRSQ